MSIYTVTAFSVFLGSLFSSVVMLKAFKRGFGKDQVPIASYVAMSVFKLVAYCGASLVIAVFVVIEDARVIFALLFVPSFVMLSAFFSSTVLFFLLKAIPVTRNTIVSGESLNTVKKLTNLLYVLAGLAVGLVVIVH